MVSTRRFTVFCFALVLSAGAVFGQGRTLWQDGGVQLCGSSAEPLMRATSDSAGGAIVVWLDTRDMYYGLYAQRVNADGVPQWTANGVLLCYDISGGPQGAVDDGEHGAIVAFGATSLSVQRVDEGGNPLWGAQGVELWHAVADGGCYASLASDGHGGAVVAWTSYQYGRPDLDSLVACHVDSNGSIAWRTCVRSESLDATSLCPDGQGGVIVTWEEYRASPWTVRVQRLDSTGALKWGSAGVRPCSLATSQHPTGCIAVSESSFVVGWLEGGGGSLQNRAQMLDLSGNRLWGPSGVRVSGVFGPNSSGAGYPVGEARQSVWVWTGLRGETDDIFAQKLDSAGTRCWDSSGIWLGTSDTSEGRSFGSTSDDRGGAIAVWPQYRGPSNWDLYGQHVDSAGHRCWSDTGLAVCRDSYIQKWTPRVVADGDGGAIVFWGDVRGIFAQRLADGAGVSEAPNAEVRATNCGPTVVRDVLRLTPSPSTSPSAGCLLDVSGRKILDLPPGANDVRALAPGIYFVREEPQATGPKPQGVWKVVITR